MNWYIITKINLTKINNTSVDDVKAVFYLFRVSPNSKYITLNNNNNVK